MTDQTAMPTTDKSSPAVSFDWDMAKKRLARIAEALDESQRLSPERAKQIMDERARKLAEVPDAAPDAGQLLGVVTFRLGGERFAVEARYVREVIRLGDVTPVPGSPEFLVGATNLRGDIMAVLDLGSFFDLRGAERSNTTRILVFGLQRAEFGVLVDAADEVASLSIKRLHPPSDSIAGGGRDFLRGVTDDAMLVLDGDVLLNDERLFIDQRE